MTGASDKFTRINILETIVIRQRLLSLDMLPTCVLI